MSLALEAGGATLGKEAGCEDAWLLTGAWMGVADGVGGWRQLGVSSGEFTRELMATCLGLIDGTEACSHPKQVVCRAVASATTLGSSTVVLGCLRSSSSRFVAVNLGDSGLLVLRAGLVVEASTPMQASFSAPFQVGHDPGSQQQQFDDPDLGETYDVGVEQGDVVVVATDGLFDYLYSRQIVASVEKCFRGGGSVRDAAVGLVRKARRKMERMTPYFQGCREHAGRVDDITVLVARVVVGDNQNEGVVRMSLESLAQMEQEEQMPSSPDLAMDVTTASCTLVESGHSHNSFFAEGVWFGLAREICQYSDNKNLCQLCGKFSAELVDKCAKLARKRADKNPLAVMKAAAASKSRCKTRKTSTLLLATLNAGGSRLLVSNIGDSRVLVIRSWKVVASTKPMCHGSEENLCDNPCKLGNAAAGAGDLGDEPDLISEYEIKVQKGDLIVCASAGVFHSLCDEAIVKTLRKALDNQTGLEEAANRLANKARQVMLEPAPWIVSLAQATGAKCRFTSDITVILRHV